MTIFKAERLANQFEHRRPGRRESVRAVGRHGFDRRHLITEPGDQRHCALSLSKGMPSHCALSLSKGTDIDRLLLLPVSRVWRLLAGVKAKPSGWPFAGSGPALTPAPGDAFKAMPGAGRGNGCGGGLGRC
jgi:hypothetical protein